MYFALLRWIIEKVQLQSLGDEPADQGPSLRFVQNEQESFWAPATRNRGPGAELSGHWHVTNLTLRNIVLVNARLADTGSQADGIAMSIRVTAIPPEGTRQVHVGFSCFPPITEGEESVKLDVIFSDNHAKKHQVCGIFYYKRAPLYCTARS